MAFRPKNSIPSKIYERNPLKTLTILLQFLKSVSLERLK